MDSSNLGGCSFVAHLAHAAAAIDAGLCEVALVTYGSTQRSDGGRLVSLSEKLIRSSPTETSPPEGAWCLTRAVAGSPTSTSVSLVYGMGMTLAAHATAVLSTEP
jgi:hypothetical protein